MNAGYLASAALAACLCLTCAQAEGPKSSSGQPVAASAAVDETTLLDPAEFAPDRVFAAPPARDSLVERLEFARLKALRAASSPARIAQAEHDGDTENPTAFDDAAGRDLAKLPATYKLLVRVQKETSRVIAAGKVYFHRLRPYGIDPSLPHCGKGKSVDRSYPSGHAGLGWSVGWTLAKLMPDRAPALLARAQDYALSREICGVHFQSDLEASHGVAVMIADRLLADPRLADQIAAARRELAQP